MIVAQINSKSGRYVGFVWLDGKRFSGSIHGRKAVQSPALAYCQHRHREQEPAERCIQRLLRRREREQVA